MSRCPLCESPAADDRAVLEVVIENTPDDFDFENGHFDGVRNKRLLEDEFDVQLPVSQTKSHVGKAATRVARRYGRSVENGGDER